MRVSRLFWFLISILLGATAGLAIGWYVRPAPMGEVPPSALRSDYRTDYVLMVAEVFEADKNLTKAAAALQQLGGETPVRTAQIAVVRAGELGYERRDLEMLARLGQSLLSPATAPTAAVSATRGANP